MDLSDVIGQPLRSVSALIELGDEIGAEKKAINIDLLFTWDATHNTLGFCFHFDPMSIALAATYIEECDKYALVASSLSLTCLQREMQYRFDDYVLTEEIDISTNAEVHPLIGCSLKHAQFLYSMGTGLADEFLLLFNDGSQVSLQMPDNTVEDVTLEVSRSK